MQTIVVVGSGLAGHTAVSELQRMGSDARIVWIGSESENPYDRPALSKRFLADDGASIGYLGNQDLETVDFRRGTTVLSINRERRTVETSDNETVRYDKLLIATGSRVRRLPVASGDMKLNYLRTSADAICLRTQLQQSKSIVIIGGGYIGLEVAAAANARGLEVCIVEAGQSFLSRTGSNLLSHWSMRALVDQGITARAGAHVMSLRRTSDERYAATTLSGDEILADVVLVAIGIEPNCDLAADAGLEVDNGIIVDGRGATSDPHIFAAGEVTRYPISRLNGLFRSESWSSSHKQALVVARAMMGRQSDRFDELSWHWSDQGPHNVQCLGMPALGVTRLVVGDPCGDEWFEMSFDARENLVGAVAVNRARDMSRLRRSLDRDGVVPAELMNIARHEPAQCS